MRDHDLVELHTAIFALAITTSVTSLPCLYWSVLLCRIFSFKWLSPNTTSEQCNPAVLARQTAENKHIAADFTSLKSDRLELSTIARKSSTVIGSLFTTGLA